ncbi:MAG: KamA family radical SAM protein [Bacteroidales bacterium]
MKENGYQSFSLHNFKKIPQIQKLSPEIIEAIEVVGRVLPFKANNYVVDELINWDNIPEDPMFTLTFPRKQMLRKGHFDAMKEAIERGAGKEEIDALVHRIRMTLNPNPAGQAHNVPSLDGRVLKGIQHKYRETVLFFPGQGQTCHAYCTFCFRWPQFAGIESLKFSMKEIDLLCKYLKRHTKVTDVLFTGGDPMVMKSGLLKSYLESLLEPGLEHVRTIRIGTKSLSYWPYRFLSDPDSDEIIALFEKIVASGKNLAIQAHFNHPVELSTPAVEAAIKRIRNTGAQIRTQTPILRHINDSPEIFAALWRKQVDLNCIPYYMFVARDTGCKHFFELPLEKCGSIYRQAYRQVSGVCRTVRGPSMSAHPGKVQFLGTAEIQGEKLFVLRFLQARNPEWVGVPFFAKYDPKATWLDQLKPASSDEKFFFEKEMESNPRLGKAFSEHIL